MSKGNSLKQTKLRKRQKLIREKLHPFIPSRQNTEEIGSDDGMPRMLLPLMLAFWRPFLFQGPIAMGAPLISRYCE